MSETPAPWERQERESDPAWRGFVEFRDLGPGRSLRQVVRLREEAVRARHGGWTAGREGERAEEQRIAAMAVSLRCEGQEGSPETAQAEAAREVARA